MLRTAFLIASLSMAVTTFAATSVALEPQGSSWPPLPPPSGGGGGGGIDPGTGPSGGGGSGGGAGGVGAGGLGSSGEYKPYGPGPKRPKPPAGPTRPPAGGYAPPSSPASPSPGVGASPAPGGPSPASPSPGAGPGGLGPAPSGPLVIPIMPGTLSGADLTTWDFWWYFNREGLLDLRRRFAEVGPTTGESILAGRPSDIPTRPSDRALTSTVLPALFAQTEDGEQATLRLSAAIALARIAEPEGAEVLATLNELLRERNPTLREGSALALGITGAPTTTADLAIVLAGELPAKRLLGYKPNDRVRAFAAYGLGLLAEDAPNDDAARTALRPLLEAFLNQKEPADLRVAALNGMSLMHIAFGPKLIAPKLQKPGKRGKLIITPRYRRDLIERLWSAYDDEDESTVLGHLPVALGRLLRGAPSDVRIPGIERLLARLDEKPKDLERYGILTALGIVGEAWGNPIDDKLRARLYAEASKQRESHARHLAFMALSEVVSNSGRLQPPAPAQAEFEAFLIESFDKGRRADRPWIALAAGSFGARLRAPGEGQQKRTKGSVGEDLVRRLREVVRASGSPDELSAAVLALGLIEDLSAADDVEALLDATRNRSVRGYAALTLGLMRQKQATFKLELLLDDLRFDPTALEHAAMGLALLDRSGGSALLRKRLSNTKSASTSAPLASAIGRVSDRGSVLSLSRLTTDADQNYKVRENASIALGLICDRDDLSWRSRLAEDVNYAAWTPTLFDSAGQGVLNIF